MLLPIALVLHFLSSSYAAIGPKADIDIVNDYIAPDGGTRSLIINFCHVMLSYSLYIVFLSSFRAVLVKYSAQPATFPGPAITGYKVTSPLSYWIVSHHPWHLSVQGNRFELNVNNFLTDKSMVIDTGIVS